MNRDMRHVQTLNNPADAADAERATAAKDGSGNLYEDVASQVVGMIDGGAFGPGDRLPSVRALHGQLGVSVTTVLEAYRLLEGWGVVRARPQSGYFVRQRPWNGVASGTRRPRKRQADNDLPPEAEPTMSQPAPGAAHVSTAELVLMFLRERRDPPFTDVVDLGMALPHPELMPSAKLNRIMARMGRQHRLEAIAYDPPPGCLALRTQLARRSLAAGFACTPDQIVTTCGGQEALTLALRAVTKPGDTVAVESPSYFGIWQAVELLGLKAVEICSHPRDGLCLDALREALDAHSIKAVVAIPTFNNPTGACIPERHRRELVELLAGRDIPLVEDDLYGDLAHENERNGAERPKACKAFDAKGLVLLCSSFTKTLAPGYRVGWIVPGRFQARVEQLKFASNIATATLPQLAIAEFLANGGYERYLRSIRRAFGRNVAMVRRAVQEAFPKGTKITRPPGGFVLWVELPEAVDSLRLYDLAHRAHVTIAPGPMFSGQQKYRNFLRLNAAYWSPDVERAVATVGRLAAEMAAGMRS